MAEDGGGFALRRGIEGIKPLAWSGKSKFGAVAAVGFLGLAGESAEKGQEGVYLAAKERGVGLPLAGDKESARKGLNGL